MSTTSLLSKLRRATPGVVDCFRNAQFYGRDRLISNGYPREMVVLFTWLGAKQKNAHKFIHCWTDRGHDVLHVTCSVRDLLFPKTGAEVTANRVVDFLDRNDNSIIVHGLSVGGYLTHRVLMQAQSANLPITHQIFDSFCTNKGIEAGVENAVHPKYRDIAKSGVKLYTKLADLSSINDAQNFAESTPYPSPSMFIHSLADKVALYSKLVPVINAAKKVGPVKLHLIPEEHQVKHVTIMKCIGEKQYMGMIYDFVEEHRQADIRNMTNHDYSCEKDSSVNMPILS